MREQSSGQSRGFGFVAFADAIGANAVLEARDHLIDGRWYGALDPLRPRHGRRTPRSSFSPLPARPHAPCGRVEAKAAVPRGTGQLHGGPGPARSPVRPAAAANRNADYSPPWDGGEEDEGSREPSSQAGQHRKVFVGGLHGDTGDASLSSYFSEFGPVDGAQVLYNRNTGRSRGFGFVTFTDAAGLAAALASRMHIIDGKLVRACTGGHCTALPPPLLLSLARSAGRGQARRPQDRARRPRPRGQRGGGGPHADTHCALRRPQPRPAADISCRLRQAVPAARSG